MCGIAGIVDWNGAPADRLDPMLKVMTHRGPDDEGSFVDHQIVMGMRRLSIIDLAGGHQPIANEDGSVIVVLNGEIYNYIELRDDLTKRGHHFRTDSDTEVLVHLYEEEGTEFLQRLNGMFAFSIWDKRERTLFIARDRLGIKPLYFAQTKNGMVYASELKSILASGVVDREINPSSLFDYLVYYYIPGEATPFRNIRKLLPGHFLKFSEQGLSIKRWWNLSDYVGRASTSLKEDQEQLRELFFDSVRLRMRSDVPVGSYLSGGLDSSLITAAAVQQTDVPFSTFSVGFSQSDFDELPFARSAAQHLGTRHHEIEVSAADAVEQLPKLVWFMDEPNGDSAILPSYLVSQLAVSKVKVALSGLGGDELFGGYPRYQQQRNKLERLGFLPRPVLRLIRPLLASMKHDWGYRLDRLIDPPPPWIQFLENTHRFDSEMIAKLCNGGTGEVGAYTRHLFETSESDDFVNRRMFVDAHTYLPDQILALTDRMSMAVSLEARTPFLDYRLVEFATGLAGEHKAHGREFKIILKQALGDLVPKEIVDRPKWGFAAPVKNWMGAQHLNALTSLLHDSKLVADGYFDSRGMEQLLGHPATPTNNSDWLWAIGVLELWYRIYCKDGGLTCPESGLTEIAQPQSHIPAKTMVD